MRTNSNYRIKKKAGQFSGIKDRDQEKSKIIQWNKGQGLGKEQDSLVE